MGTKQDHTPLPWVVQDNSDERYGQLRVDSVTEGAVAVVGLRAGEPLGAEFHANAALIVRAVNAHADLLEAAEGALQWIEDCGELRDGDSGCTDALRTAITKARGHR